MSDSMLYIALNCTFIWHSLYCLVRFLTVYHYPAITIDIAHHIVSVSICHLVYVT